METLAGRPQRTLEQAGAADPESRGQFDPENTVHDMAMSIAGGLSKSERRHVRAAMAAQVVADGRHQGRAPYGCVVVDAGPNPNPRKVQEGYRQRVLALGNETVAA